MVKKKTILLVDDHPVFRAGIVSLLSKQAGYEVVAEAAEGNEGIAKAEEFRPDVVVMDISLPDMSGIDAAERIAKSLPQTKVVMLSIHSNIELITKAFKAGASGYITKDATGEKLVECLRTVMKGECYMDTVVSKSVVKDIFAKKEEKRKVIGPSYSTLTHREQEIMRLIAEGLSAKQIADKLCISQKTVENHRANIFSKLNIHGTLELVRFAAKYGIIDVEMWKE